MDLKACLRGITLELRRELEGRYDDQGKLQPGDLELRLAALGVRRDREVMPASALPNNTPVEDREARRVADAFILSRTEAGLSREAAVGELVRESAYSWANRLLALRCMEARGLIDEVILQKDAYGGRSLQHHRLVKKQPDRCTGADEGLFAALFDEFARRAVDLPALFDPAAPEVALRPSVPTIKRCVGLLSGAVVVKGQEAATDEVFTAPDALGWAYQYWNTEEKDRVFAAAAGKGPDRKRHKIQGADIVPATCFYTDSYMVSFLVQNSLGALWAGMRPGSRLVEGWKYFVRDADRAAVSRKAVREITFLDPACGSGHFLLEAFDVFYTMYEEEGALTEAAEICGSILENNLFGIDIDERAVQLAALSLVMRAKEKAPDFVPRRLNLVATNIRLPGGKAHLEEFLKKHPEDAPLKPALTMIFESLAHADELGSLLQIEEPVEKELRYLKERFESAKSWPAQQVLFPGELPLGVESYEAWKVRTLARLREHFEAEAGARDLASALFGEAAGKGLSLVDVLARRYDVVAANPPYMGSKNMGPVLKRHVEHRFESGRRDLYAAFILRCVELAGSGGRVAMVTQQSWMFLNSFAAFRGASGQADGAPPKHGLLRELGFEAIVHLGRYAFSEIGNAAVAPAMAILRKDVPDAHHRLWACRLSAPRPSEQQASLLRDAVAGKANEFVYRPAQARFLTIPEAPVCYWLRERFFELLSGRTLGDVASVYQGLATANDPRFVRYGWEIPAGAWRAPARARRWVSFEKGGGYGKWFGHHLWVVDWDHAGARIKATPGPRVQNEHHYCKEGWAYSSMASGSLSVRRIRGAIWGAVMSDAVISPIPDDAVGAVLNCRLASASVRWLRPQIVLSGSYVSRVPYPRDAIQRLARLGASCVSLKEWLVARDPREWSFLDSSPAAARSLVEAHRADADVSEAVSAILHGIEGSSEEAVLAAQGIDGDDLAAIVAETGMPVGWYPVMASRAAFPGIPIALNELTSAVADRARANAPQLDEEAFGQRLRRLYEAGPGVAERNEVGVDEAATDADESDESDSVLGAPIPAETFLEELSQKLQIHPISVHWLLRELREKDGVVCLPELRRFVEDHFSVLILRLLGHRWPKRIEAAEPLPPWADADGIIPLIEGAGEPPLLDRLRDRIAEDFGPDRVQPIEREFQEILGKPLSTWILTDFFKRHTSQFKKRPIAWQIESRPTTTTKRRARGAAPRSAPAFSCLVYYHRLDADLLPKIRTQYLGPMRTRIETELRGLEAIALRTPEQDTRRADLTNKVEELRDLDAAIAKVDPEAFASPALDAIAAKELLDPWTSRDGIAPPPATRDAFLAQERRYDPDINDGVRVNIAPIQKAGLLAAEVIAVKDLDKAIADRAEWRADERRWCREGKLPRPGWWPAEDKAASPALQVPEIQPVLPPAKAAALFICAAIHAGGGKLEQLTLARVFSLWLHPKLLVDFATDTERAQASAWASRVGPRECPPGFLQKTVQTLVKRKALQFAADSLFDHVALTITQHTPKSDDIHDWFHFEAQLALRVAKRLGSGAAQAVEDALSTVDRDYESWRVA